MIVTRQAVDAIEMIAQIAGTGAGNMMIVMITLELVSLAIEAMEATAVDTAVVDTADLTRVLAQTSLTATICSMVHVTRTRTWRTESGNRVTR
jgi:hypothetical protein